MTVDEMVPKVREALAVSSSYDAVTIPYGIRRTMKRLLRDYNFPKSVRVHELVGVAAGTYSYTAPDGLKRTLELRFYNAADGTYTEALRRAEGFRLPPANASTEQLYGYHYWLQGNAIVVDTPLPVAGLNLRLWHQSMVVDAAAEAWMLDDLEDLIFSRSVFRLATELRKTEVAQVFAQLVSEDTQSIAIYANELEWHGVETIMREPRGLPGERYPA